MDLCRVVESCARAFKNIAKPGAIKV